MSGRKLPGIVIMASGRGSNFEALVRAMKEGRLRAKPLALVVDRLCGAVEKAERLGVRWIKLQKPWREHLKELLTELSPDLIVLAGFMRILPPDIVNSWRYRIVNIHPSLLPAFPGIDAIRKAYEYGVKVTGITIHFVDEGVDTGPIIFQKAIEIDQSWSLEELEERIHELEHKNYYRVVERILEGNWKVEGRKVLWI